RAEAEAPQHVAGAEPGLVVDRRAGCSLPTRRGVAALSSCLPPKRPSHSHRQHSGRAPGPESTHHAWWRGVGATRETGLTAVRETPEGETHPRGRIRRRTRDGV